MCLHDGSLDFHHESTTERQLPPTARPLSDIHVYSSLTPPNDFSSPRVIPRPSSFGKNRVSSDPANAVEIENWQPRLPYLQKLRDACKTSGYSDAYADFIGSQFLGLGNDFSGDVPGLDDVVECATQALLRLVSFADLTYIFFDDFQWVDSLTWKVLRALGQSGHKLLLLCATRSHDKQAMRRLMGLNFRMEISLGPLALPDIRALVASVLSLPAGIEVDNLLCNQIFEMTGGGLPTLALEFLENVKRNGAYVCSEEDNCVRINDFGQLSKVCTCVRPACFCVS